MDSVEPPCIVLSWDDPWLTFQTPCWWYAQLAVSLFAPRTEPESGVATLEDLAGYAMTRIGADPYSFVPESSLAPRFVEYAGLPMLAARLSYRAPVRIAAPAARQQEEAA